MVTQTELRNIDYLAAALTAGPMCDSARAFMPAPGASDLRRASDIAGAFAPGLDWIGRNPPKLYPGHSRGEVSYMQPGQATLLAGPETNGQLKTR